MPESEQANATRSRSVSKNLTTSLHKGRGGDGNDRKKGGAEGAKGVESVPCLGHPRDFGNPSRGPPKQKKYTGAGNSRRGERQEGEGQPGLKERNCLKAKFYPEIRPTGYHTAKVDWGRPGRGGRGGGQDQLRGKHNCP